MKDNCCKIFRVIFENLLKIKFLSINRVKLKKQMNSSFIFYQKISSSCTFHCKCNEHAFHALFYAEWTEKTNKARDFNWKIEQNFCSTGHVYIFYIVCSLFYVLWAKDRYCVKNLCVGLKASIYAYRMTFNCHHFLYMISLFCPSWASSNQPNAFLLTTIKFSCIR